MFSKFSEDAQKTLLLAKKEMVDLKHPYVGSEHLMLAMLSNKKYTITKKLKKYNINYENFKDKLISIVGVGKDANNWFLYTPLLKRIIENAIFDSRERGENKVTIEQLFISMLEEGDGVGIRVLISLGIDVDNLYSVCNNRFNNKKYRKDKKLLVNDFAINFNKKVLANEVDPVVARDMEVDRLIEILSRRCKNNPLLIGEAGVGKTAIVEELARRIVNHDVPKFLQNKVILSVSISSMVAGTKYRGEFEERVNKILKEVEENKNIILFIDEIHTIVGAGGAEGAIDASNILKPSLARGKIRIIGATTTVEYHASIEKDKALDRRFQKITVLEPDYENTLKILTRLKPIYSKYHDVSINNDILKYIIKISDSYIANQKNPDKSIDILDEVCAKASLFMTDCEKESKKLSLELQRIIDEKNNYVIDGNFEKANELKIKQFELEDIINKKSLKKKNKQPIKITKDLVNQVVFMKTKIPVYEINNNSFDVLKLEKDLNKKIIGQKRIISELCNYTKLFKSGFMKDRPYSFLLIGSTGVGKTMLVKEYARKVFGKNNFFRVDMSEFKEEHSISKIIGSPPGYVGYQDDNYILEKIRNNPHSVILLDEVEKASKSVLKLFLQAMDEGIMHDASGREVSFKHVIIFMTSNIGTDKNNLGFNEYNDSSTLKNFFSVEFINRLDKIFRFDKLDYDDIKKIVNSKLDIILKNYYDKNIIIKVDDDLIKKIIDKSEFVEFGARKIDKIIDSVINTYIIDMIINGNDVISLKELEV